MRSSVFTPRAVFAAVFAAWVGSAAFCEPELSFNALAAYYPSHHWGYRDDGLSQPDYTVVEGGEGERDIGSSWGGVEAKAIFSAESRTPFLAGSGPLFADNRLGSKLSAEFSPVSINAVCSFSFQPIAFLVFESGGAAGTGWNVGPFRGLGLNPRGSYDSDDFDLESFGGAVWRVWGAGTFQFDFAAVVPGRWNHVVVLATGKVEYKAYMGADGREAWLWEADQGENFNGAKFSGTYVLAYRMPLVLDVAGLMAESEEWIGAVRSYSPMSETGGWGSDFRTWRVGSLADFALGARDSLAVLCQFKLRPDWTDDTTLMRDFRDRDWDGSYWHFDRVALSYTHRFLPGGSSR